MNRRDFLKSTAALATVAVAGKAVGKAEHQPSVAILDDSIAHMDAEAETIGDIVKRKIRETQDGIVETYERSWGQYANGDWWVIGPVVIDPAKSPPECFL